MYCCVNYYLFFLVFVMALEAAATAALGAAATAVVRGGWPFGTAKVQISCDIQRLFRCKYF